MSRNLEPLYQEIKSHDPQVSFFKLVTEVSFSAEALAPSLNIDFVNAASPEECLPSTDLSCIPETPLSRGSKLAEGFYAKLVRNSTQSKVINTPELKLSTI